MVQNHYFRTKIGSVITNLYRANYSLCFEKMVDFHTVVKILYI